MGCGKTNNASDPNEVVSFTLPDEVIKGFATIFAQTLKPKVTKPLARAKSRPKSRNKSRNHENVSDNSELRESNPSILIDDISKILNNIENFEAMSEFEGLEEEKDEVIRPPHNLGLDFNYKEMTPKPAKVKIIEKDNENIENYKQEFSFNEENRAEQKEEFEISPTKTDKTPERTNLNQSIDISEEIDISPKIKKSTKKVILKQNIDLTEEVNLSPKLKKIMTKIT